MVIQHNLTALNSNRQLGITTGNLARSSEKLSSGYKINRAADDAASLSISEKMRRQIRGLSQASYNAQDGISLVQVADGAMAEVHDMLHRGNELAVKAANDTLSQTDRAYIQIEINKIIEEIDAINVKTTFNEKYVLQGKSSGGTTPGGASIESGSKLPDWAAFSDNEGGKMSGTYNSVYTAGKIDFSSFDGSDAKKAELAGTGFYSTCCTCDEHYSIKFNTDGNDSKEVSGKEKIFNIDISSCNNADDLVNKIAAINTEHYTEYKNGGNGVLVIHDNRPNQKPGDNKGLLGNGVAVEGPGNLEPDLILQVGGENAVSDQIMIQLPYISSKTCKIDGVSVMSHTLAVSAIDSFKEGLAFVSSERSRMGSYQNRLVHTVRNLDNVVENTQKAESQIRDTDMAAEMVKNSNLKILSQAGQAMLAQANQTTQGVLSLLK